MRTISFDDLSVSATVQITTPTDPIQDRFYVSLIIDGSETGEIASAPTGEAAIRAAAERYAKDESVGVAVAFISTVRGEVVAVATLHKVANFPCS